MININLIKSDISLIVAQANYGVCYEPIISLTDMSIIGYEALSRFKQNNTLVPPNVVFKALHEDIDMFFYVESVMKRFQLERRPDNKTLFLNLDPDVSLQDSQIDFWVNLLKSTEHVVVEIIENSDDENVEDIKNFMDWLKVNDIEYAYDDFGKPNSIFFNSLLETATYIKLDIHFIKNIRIDKNYIELVRGIINYTKAKNKYIIMEGIEDEKDLEIAKSLDIDYVQGYLFKDDFKNVWK